MPIFHEWARNGVQTDPSISRIAFYAAMNKDPTHTIGILKDAWAKSTSDDEKDNLLNALTVTNDEETIRRLVAFNFAPSSSADSVPVSDMSALLMGFRYNTVGRHIQWQYVKDNWDAFLDKVSNWNKLSRYIGIILAGFTSKTAVQDLDTFFQDKDTKCFSRTLQNAKEGILSRASSREADSETLRQWLTDNNYMA